jgi:hypothetical protein
MRKKYSSEKLGAVLTIGVILIGCSQFFQDQDRAEGKTVPQEIRGIWVGDIFTVAFSSASVSFLNNLNGRQSIVYEITRVSDHSIFAMDVDEEKLFANYSMPDTNTLSLSGGEFGSNGGRGTYIKDTE